MRSLLRSRALVVVLAAAGVAGTTASACNAFAPAGVTDPDAAVSPPSPPSDGASPSCVGVDFATDPKHCGRCEHDCLGGACALGRCAPYEVASELDRPYYLGLDSQAVFISSIEGAVGITRVLKATGERGVVAQSKAFGLFVEVQGSYVFFCDNSTPKVARVGKDGSGLTTLVSTRCTELLVRDGRLFFTDFKSDRVHSAWEDGGSSFALFEPDAGVEAGSSAPEGIVVDDKDVFFAEHRGGRVSAVPRNGGAVRLVDVGIQPRRLVADTSHIYWTQHQSPTIRRVTKTGQGAEDVADGPAYTVEGGIAIDETHVYWISSSNADGQLLRARKDGPRNNGLEVLVTGLARPIDVALDGNAIYYTVNGVTPNTGKLMRLAKP